MLVHLVVVLSMRLMADYRDCILGQSTGNCSCYDASFCIWWGLPPLDLVVGNILLGLLSPWLTGEFTSCPVCIVTHYFYFWFMTGVTAILVWGAGVLALVVTSILLQSQRSHIGEPVGTYLMHETALTVKLSLFTWKAHASNHRLSYSFKNAWFYYLII